MTNEELVVDLMNYSPYGALSQVFVIESIRVYSNMIKESQPDPSKPDTGFVTRETWKNIAIDISKRLEDNYNSFKKETKPSTSTDNV